MAKLTNENIEFLANKTDKEEALDIINKAYLDDQINSTEMELRVNKVNQISKVEELNKVISDINNLNFKEKFQEANWIEKKENIATVVIALTLSITFFLLFFAFYHFASGDMFISDKEYLTNTYNELVINIDDAQKEYYKVNNTYSSDIYQLTALDKELDNIVKEISDEEVMPLAEIELEDNKTSYELKTDLGIGNHYKTLDSQSENDDSYRLIASYKVSNNKTVENNCIIEAQLSLGETKYKC